MPDYTLRPESRNKVVAHDAQGRPFMILRHYGQPWGPDVERAARRFVDAYFQSRTSVFSPFHPDYPAATAEAQMLGELLTPPAHALAA